MTIKMSQPFPDMDYWGAFMAMGPTPLGKVSDPPEYGRSPLSTGPYKVESFRPSEELVLVKNDAWVADSDPARHQYADKWIFKFAADPTQTDELMLSGNTESQTALSASITAENYAKFNQDLGDRLVQQSAQCTSFWAPDYEKTTPEIRKALAYAYPYESVWQASGEVPGVTRVPANSVMPPGMAGKSDYQVDGEQITYQPEKAKELLAEAGEEGYEIHMAYNTGSPTTEAAQKQIEKGLTDSGFKVTSYPVPIETSLYTIWTDPDNKINKKLNLRGVNWCSDWPSGCHDDPGPAPHGRHLQHGVLLRGVHGREDGRDRHHADRGAARRLGCPGRADRDRVLPDHPDRVPQRPLRLRREDREPDR